MVNAQNITYDPTDPECLSDPFPHYRQLRDVAPVYYSDMMDKWVVSRYDDCQSLLRDPRVYSAERGYGPVFDATFKVHGSPGLHALFRPVSRGRSILASDPPIHSDLRRLISRRFTAKAMAELEPRIRLSVEAVVDRLLERSADGEVVDLVAEFAALVPFMAIVELMDIPDADQPAFRKWIEVMTFGVGGTTIDDPDLAEASAELCAYFDEMAEERERDPGDDLISSLVRGGSVLEPPLSREEITAYSVLLFLAGTSTTTGLLSNWLGLALSRRPDLLADIRADPELIAPSLEEMLRYENANQSVVRCLTESVSLGGALVPAGSSVIILLGSGNRDERHYGDDAGEYRISRNPSDALGFGAGVHLCLGAPLARLESRVALDVLRKKTSAIRLAGDMTFNHSFMLRSCSAVPARLESV